jgi:hypothetical protein
MKKGLAQGLISFSNGHLETLIQTEGGEVVDQTNLRRT